MGITLLGSTGMTVGALDPTDLHVEYVAYDLGSLFYLPTSGVLAGSKHGGERDRWIDLLGSGISDLQAVQCPELEKQLQRFSMMMGMQSTQLAACDCLHDVVERLARWLLMSHDRIGGATLPLTQGSSPRCWASVTVAAGTLQKAGMSQYSRGSVSILDRLKLEADACDCYQLIERRKLKWQEEAS